jgi:hypothetical protein
MGVQVVMQINGANIRTGNAVVLSAGRSVIPATTYSSGTIPLALMDLCSGTIITPTKTPFSSVIATPAPTSTITAPGPLSGLDARGCLVDARGTMISFTCGYYFLSGGVKPVAVGRGNYPAYLNGQPISVTSMNPPTGLMVDGRGSPVLIVASGAGNYQIKVAGYIVASGAGNIVASGAGNIVASGAGNIILNGGGNIVASGAGNLQVTTSAAMAAQLTGLLATNGMSLISQDGLSIVNTNGSNLLR